MLSAITVCNKQTDRGPTFTEEIIEVKERLQPYDYDNTTVRSPCICQNETKELGVLA